MRVNHFLIMPSLPCGSPSLARITENSFRQQFLNGWSVQDYSDGWCQDAEMIHTALILVPWECGHT